MGKFATRKTLRELCSRNGITLYKHRLDGASWQYCAGGYVVNGYAMCRPMADILYSMQKTLILLLKYGDDNDSEGDDDVVWHKEKHTVGPLARTVNGYGLGQIYTFHLPETDVELQQWFDLRNS